MYRNMTECQNGGENFNLSFAPRMNVWVMSKPKCWPASKSLPSGYQMYKSRKTACGLPHPALGCWDAGITCPKRIWRELRTIEWCGTKKWWHWPWPSRGAPFIWECPPGMLCRAVQELCRCLTSVIESGDLVNLRMLDMAENDPMALTSKGRAPSQMPRVVPPFSVPAPSELTASEPGEVAPPEELALVPRWRPLALPGFSLSWADESDSPPPEQEDWPMSIPLATQLDFASLGSIQVTILHFPVMSEVHWEYQSQTIAWGPWPRVPCNWPSLNPLINLNLRRSSEQMQHSLPDPWVTISLPDS